ncbi:hypothetical protein BDR07DRAFT_1398512 [Suillus spraguei]|nr:hypothetical protein BDR07DRAFT_1438089 [Suillus spraguei]KAG2365575.1 hypothetical protein BDR07DRAFT_1398512 [Suillus spraguei]
MFDRLSLVLACRHILPSIFAVFKCSAGANVSLLTLSPSYKHCIMTVAQLTWCNDCRDHTYTKFASYLYLFSNRMTIVSNDPI